MTPAVEKLLDDFDHLTAFEQQTALAAVLRRASGKPLSDDDLAALADELFQAPDAEEEHDNSGTG
jgi:hypothetical protein